MYRSTETMKSRFSKDLSRRLPLGVDSTGFPAIVNRQRSWPPPGVGVSISSANAATGSARGLEQALAATRPRGTLILKSTVADRPAIDLAPLVIDEIQVIGSRCGPFEPALAALAEGRVTTEPLVTETLPLARAAQALSRASEPGILKVLIDPTS